LVAFINNKSKGSIFTITKALQERISVIVFPFNAELPSFQGVEWSALKEKSWEGAYEAFYLN